MWNFFFFLTWAVKTRIIVFKTKPICADTLLECLQHRYRVCNTYWIHWQYLHYWSCIFAYKNELSSKVMEEIITACFLSGFYSIYFGFVVFWSVVWPMLPIFSSKRLDVRTMGSHQTTVLAPQWNLPKQPSDSWPYQSSISIVVIIPCENLKLSLGKHRCIFLRSYWTSLIALFSL